MSESNLDAPHLRLFLSCYEVRSEWIKDQFLYSWDQLTLLVMVVLYLLFKHTYSQTLIISAHRCTSLL